MANIELFHDDCLKVLPNITDKSIDLILCDLPYSVSACTWDKLIPVEKLWDQYKRVLKDDGVILLFGREPFSSLLRSSNLKMYKFDWYWVKPNGADFLNVKYKPFNVIETISVFTNNPVSYSKKHVGKQIRYFPQFEQGKSYITKSGKQKNNASTVRSEIKSIVTENTGTRYPKNTLFFSRDKEKLHSTQKPVALLEYLIKTYTTEGEKVLDNCMGSGSTGVAAKNLNRKFIGIELEKKYFDIAEKRINGEIVYRKIEEPELNYKLPGF